MYFCKMFINKKIFFGLVLIVFIHTFIACGTQSKVIKNYTNDNAKDYFSGLMLYDPLKEKVLINHNSKKYFTPASTVKLFTLYTALHYLKDSIASISYFENGDTIYIKPLADPSFLHDSLPNSTFDFLKKQTKNIAIVTDKFEDFIYGDGWQWDDYQYYYMPEKSLFPLYGNVALFDGAKIIPSFFQNRLNQTDIPDFHRDFFDNQFYYNKKSKINIRKIPFKTSLELSVQLLADTLKKPINLIDKKVGMHFKPYISTPTYPLYGRLMRESENFMAEHLFLQIAKQKFNEYKVQSAITMALDSLFSDIPQKPRWVDASGLSRYNLFTPHDMVYLLDKMVRDFEKEKILQLMPLNGPGGILQKWYPFETTYLYAKTGSVSNNHSLSGYIITKKGTFLIFSYMNNNFTKKSSEIRMEMNEVLQSIYHWY